MDKEISPGTAFNREQPSQLSEIIALSPSTLTQDSYQELGIPELVRAYGGTISDDPEALLERIDLEFGGGEDKDILFYQIDGKTTASLSVDKLTPENKSGKNFWRSIQRSHPSLFERSVRFNLVSLDIDGIVTLPEHRQQGHQRALLEKAIIDTNPAIVTAYTKTPELVSACSTIFEEHGYRTFFGYTEVTPGHPVDSTNDHSAIITAYMNLAPQDPTLQTYGIKSIAQNFLPPTIPEVNHLPLNVQISFQDLVAFQKEWQNRKLHGTIVKPLIMVKSEVLPLKAPYAVFQSASQNVFNSFRK